jgi:hypothetical protein
MWLKIVITILIVSFVSVYILFVTNVIKYNKTTGKITRNNVQSKNPKNRDNPNNRDNPKNYDNQPEKVEQFKSANLCNDKVLYPLQSLDVDYGPESSIPDNCPCLQFVKSP